MQRVASPPILAASSLPARCLLTDPQVCCLGFGAPAERHDKLTETLLTAVTPHPHPPTHTALTLSIVFRSARHACSQAYESERAAVSARGSRGAGLQVKSDDWLD